MGGWNDTWSDILNGGNPRWKVTDEKCHEKALSHFQSFVSTTDTSSSSADISVLCPLAGDDPFVYLLWIMGYSVTTIDLVPDAVEAMKVQFGGSPNDWSKVKPDDEKDESVYWSHVSGRATLVVGDALQHRSTWVNRFDAVYDKDSFGALGVQMRKGFCTRMGEYVKSGGMVYLECKLKDNHEEVKGQGPPHSLKKEDLMEATSYGDAFDHVEELGAVYDLPGPMGSTMKQTGHIMKRK
eukprot:CAMPEP_0197261344 /NCGR_PEP_ID=MMETSP1429-20130617/84497_1 /TAXON_ID=49237 /ORGANISM="Chaetoceros  sp., Strain UNC1202" /LENGTH=238 /DNA_ID=CAMNT_0042725607 /DNA_START=108 /DNA_END=824 /DNA_ORIENTATION=-